MLPCWFWVWWVAQAGEAIPSCARLDHGSCQSSFIFLGAASLFQPADPQQDTVSLNHGVNQALVQLVWPCCGQVSSLAPPGAVMAALGSRSCPEEPRQDASTLQGAEHLFLLGCSVCLRVHGSPGDESRAGKRLNMLDTKPFPHQQHMPSDVWMCSQSLYLSSAQHFPNLGTGEPGSLPAIIHLDHFSNHFISGCSGSVVSSDLLAEAMGGSMDLGWHVGLTVIALPLQDVTASRKPSSSSLQTDDGTLFFLANQAECSGLLAMWTLTFLRFPSRSCSYTPACRSRHFPWGLLWKNEWRILVFCTDRAEQWPWHCWDQLHPPWQCLGRMFGVSLGWGL